MLKKIRAGNMNAKITVQSLVESDDGAGGIETTWLDKSLIWGEIRSLRLSERIVAYKFINAICMIVITRYMSDIMVSDRLVFNNKIYRIRGIFNLSNKSFIEIIVEETNEKSAY